jgi:hypothetical protein
VGFRVEALDNGEHLAEALDREERNRADGRRVGWTEGVSGPTHGNGGVTAIGQPHDEVRVAAAPDPDDLDLLAPERMVGMDHRDVFGRQPG